MAEKIAFDLINDAADTIFYLDAPEPQEPEMDLESLLTSEYDVEPGDVEFELGPDEDEDGDEGEEAELELNEEDDESEDDGPIELEFELGGNDEGIGDLELVDDLNTDSESEADILEFLHNSGDMLPGAKVVLVKEEEPVRETTWEDDSDHKKFIRYLSEKMQSIPQHSGQTTVGCEKAISYLRKLDKEISKAIQGDEDNVIDESEAETIRDKIHEYVDMLEDAYDGLVSKKRRKKKKASFSLGKKVFARINDGEDLQYFISVTSSDDEERLFQVDLECPTDEQVQAFVASRGITKEAGDLTVIVDPFLQSITRLLITAHVRQGKNLQDVYSQLDDQYNFTTREQLSIHELLLQKGLPLNADLGRLQEKDISPMDSKNVEYSTEFYA